MYIYLKRLFDIVLSLFGLLVLSPILLVVAIILALDFKDTPFFTQSRPGKNEKIFKVLKFKTMNNKKDKNGELLSDTERLTALGIFIRKTSIDELPQLFNVLIGDMSLIGPRPLLVKYLPYYKPEERIRFSVRPGITGLAQVTGRNYMSWDEKFRKDIYYVKNLSFKQDAQIFYKTLIKVFQTSDVELDQSSYMADLDIERKDYTITS
ncbi:Sugar transferase involved in LPS biosynthesis (colanic, teichoic acid) [Maribacter dokdonensis]|uniref:Sugar transferase involved in LPS biosynthesis (Colanic, teichoic acid) n=1 Tax=Maribacter dokdonensis TaxID=320912 RepID=A0A1H4QDE0_9FLAO|nr:MULTISPECIES: sugar transferase [Maribacter]SEC17502.1 Sugar transferase involved in LPS biosynthesis (colanic, teichoic acid) [Maribacter dokdonensis]